MPLADLRKRLFASFYEHLNPIVALLDPQIYSRIRLLQRPEYRLLLASICTVSAKFCMPKHYAECLQFLDPALAMIAAGDVPPHLETEFELGLHRSFQQSSQLREDIQAQRSFLQLACFEDGYKDQCGMPLSIDASFLPEPWKWIESLGDAVQSIDIRLAASRENALVKQQLIRQLADSSEVSKAACLHKVRLINTAIAAQERNARAWMDPTVYGLPCQHSGRPCLLFHNTNTLFNYYRALHAVYCAPALTTFVELREGTFLKCCELSIELFELFNGPYGEYEYYRFVHDIVILNLAVAAVWISDNWQLMPTSLAHQAIAAVCSAATITAASCERKLEQASYLARFLAFCTTKFSAFATSEGRAGNDDVSPADPDTGTGQALEHAPDGRGDTFSPSPVYVQSDATRYLQELLTAPCVQVSNDAIDTNSILSFFQESTWH